MVISNVNDGEKRILGKVTGCRPDEYTDFKNRGCGEPETRPDISDEWRTHAEVYPLERNCSRFDVVLKPQVFSIVLRSKIALFHYFVNCVAMEENKPNYTKT